MDGLRGGSGCSKPALVLVTAGGPGSDLCLLQPPSNSQVMWPSSAPVGREGEPVHSVAGAGGLQSHSTRDESIHRQSGECREP